MKPTPSKRSRAGEPSVGRARRPGRSVTVSGASSSSPIRSQALAVSCAKANRKPSDRIGHSSTVNRATKPTRPPTVSAPVFTATAPPTRMSARVTCGWNSKTHHSSASVRTLSSSQPAQPGGLRVVAVEHQPAAAQRLHHPDALDGLLDVGGQLALLVLHRAATGCCSAAPSAGPATDSGTVVSSTARPSGQ